MNLRLANQEDLPKLQEMYNKIIENMYKNNIKIWNKYYPYEEFQNDINNNNLYLLTANETIIAAFSLYETDKYDNLISWQEPHAKSIYIGRIGVNVNYLNQGIGSLVLTQAKNLSKEKNYQYLRLLVVENNIPAINLYIKNHFHKVKGIYHEDVGNGILNEYGFEIKI